jgi:hypothetical protein
MLRAAAWLLALAIAVSATPAAAHRCAVTPIELSAARIDAILQEPELNRQIEFADELGRYWMAHCASVRAEAAPPVVRQVARLLANRDARFFAATMLVDVGPNLDVARPGIEAALADATAEFERVRRTNPALLSPGHHIAALQCLAHKLETGELDQDLCSAVLGARESEGGLQTDVGLQ